MRYLIRMIERLNNIVLKYVVYAFIGKYTEVDGRISD